MCFALRVEIDDHITVGFLSVEKGKLMLDFLKEIIDKRNLLRELVMKDLKVRYQRPALGFLWTMLSPLLTVAVFYMIFGLLLKIQTSGTPFILYLITAVFPWTFFQDSLMRSTTSLVENKNLIKESASPQYLIPMAIILTNAIIFLPILLIILVTAGIVLKGVPWQIVLLPLLLLIHFMLIYGMSLLFSVIYVRWRDLKYILEPLLMFIFYMTPSFYSINLIKSGLSPLLYKLYTYNPMVGFLNLYRITLLKGFAGSQAGDTDIIALLILPILFSISSFSLGLYYYNRKKAIINDYLYY